MNQQLKSRFLPTNWRFVPETRMPLRGSSLLSSTIPRVTYSLCHPLTTLSSYRSTLNSSPPPSGKKSHAKSAQKRHTMYFCSKKQECHEAAETAYRRRLSRARNVYDRLHITGEIDETSQRFKENLKQLGLLEVTAMYMKHLETRKLRVPVAIRGTDQLVSAG